MRELDLVGVQIKGPQDAPVVLLREVSGGRYLPIWIGSQEAAAIANAQEQIIPPRPLTHDLLIETLDATGNRLRSVQITALNEGTFYAELLLDSGVSISARPSDAIALAIRCGADIFCAEDVLEEASVAAPTEEQEEVDAFLDFLDNVSPDDFINGESDKD